MSTGTGTGTGIIGPLVESGEARVFERSWEVGVRIGMSFEKGMVGVWYVVCGVLRGSGVGWEWWV